MKKIFTFILFTMISLNVFGFSGVLSGEKDLKIVQTKWFDIIYPERCEKSASILYENADGIYEEVTGQYGLTPGFRVPVVISPGVDVLNAFFSSVPYNRIVMYDTSSEEFDQLSSVFSETFLSVFTHELTHCVTYNMKNGFWQGFGNIFGDGLVPGMFLVTSGMAEGASVASESKNGEGRLNNEYAEHFVKQAKIEDCFPGYFDVQGSSERIISGAEYYFNGAFHQWLQEVYGMEKYAQFWHRVINMSRPGIFWSFWKTYGLSIRKAWKKFEESYVVPKIPGNPVESGLVNDFFEPAKEKYSNSNNLGRRYFSLSSSEKGIIFAESYSGNVYFVPVEDFSKEKIRPKKLFSQSGLSGVSFSKDGRFITVSYISDLDSNMTTQIKIYDFNKKQFSYVGEKGIKNGSVIKSQGDYYLICAKYNSPYNNILINKLIFNGNSVSFEKIKELPQELNVFVGDFIECAENAFGYVKKSGMEYSICISDLSGEIINEFSLPQGVSGRNLSENQGLLYFSWVKEGTMPRLGILDPKSGIIQFSNVDVSGGIFEPVVFAKNSKKKVIYNGEFFKENRILTFQEDNDIFVNTTEYVSKKTQSIKSSSKTKNGHGKILTDISGLSKNYNFFSNFRYGIMVPLSIYSTELFGDNYGDFSVSQYLPFGITYASGNPWTFGSDDLFLITAGWSYLTNSLGIETILSKGCATDIFSYVIDLKTEFDRHGWKQSSGALSFSSGFNAGKNSYFYIQNNMKVSGGKQNNLSSQINYFNLLTFWDKNLFESFAPSDEPMGLIVANDIYLSYSNIHRMGPSRFELGGFSLGLGFSHIFDSKIGDFSAVDADFTVALPKLLPIPQKKEFVYTLPTVLSMTLFPLNSDYGMSNLSVKKAGYAVVDFNVNTVFFGMDIQKPIPFLEFLYIQDFYLSGGYTSTIASYKGSKTGFQFPYIFEYLHNLKNGNSLYLDGVYLKCALEFNLNVGSLAAPEYKMNIYGILSYPINVLKPEDQNLKFTFGLETFF